MDANPRPGPTSRSNSYREPEPHARAWRLISTQPLGVSPRFLRIDRAGLQPWGTTRGNSTWRLGQAGIDRTGGAEATGRRVSDGKVARSVSKGGLRVNARSALVRQHRLLKDWPQPDSELVAGSCSEWQPLELAATNWHQPAWPPSASHRVHPPSHWPGRQWNTELAAQ